MKLIFTSILAFTVLLTTSCGNQPSKTQEEKPETLNDREKHAITMVVRDMYQWHENTEIQADFQPMLKSESDSMYSGLDWMTFNKQLRAIRTCGYFSPEFIANYEAIAHYIDEELKSGRITWYVGEMSPLDTGANPWCNCQDTPNDHFWTDIELSDYEITDDVIAFSWSWGGDFKYKAAVSRKTKKIKISWLEGFDPKEWRNN